MPDFAESEDDKPSERNIFSTLKYSDHPIDFIGLIRENRADALPWRPLREQRGRPRRKSPERETTNVFFPGEGRLGLLNLKTRASLLGSVDIWPDNKLIQSVVNI